jgi:DNA polymerase V
VDDFYAARDNTMPSLPWPSIAPPFTPQTLFDQARPKSPELMKALDDVNDRFGKKTMVLASEGMKQAWRLRADHRSPRYTTRMEDLPVVK